MSCDSTGNIAIRPVNVYWRMWQIEHIDFAGLTGTSVAGKSFNISTANDAILNYVWFDTGASTDPATPGRVGVEVTVVGGDTPTLLASKTAAIIEALAGYTATSEGSVLTVKRVTYGEVTDAEDDDSGVEIEVCRKGRDLNLGLLQGDVELNFSPSNLNITAHQYGLTPIASLNQGFETIEVTTTLQETAKSNLKSFYDLYGGEFTPMTGTEIFGVGSISQGKNMLSEAGRLVLKPVNAQNDVENVNVMLAIPTPGTLTFSGENTSTLAVTWQGFVDPDFNTKANVIAIGDVFQAGV